MAENILVLELHRMFTRDNLLSILVSREINDKQYHVNTWYPYVKLKQEMKIRTSNINIMYALAMKRSRGRDRRANWTNIEFTSEKVRITKQLRADESLCLKKIDFLYWKSLFRIFLQTFICLPLIKNSQDLSSSEGCIVNELIFSRKFILPFYIETLSGLPLKWNLNSQHFTNKHFGKKYIIFQHTAQKIHFNSSGADQSPVNIIPCACYLSIRQVPSSSSSSVVCTFALDARGPGIDSHHGRRFVISII